MGAAGRKNYRKALKSLDWRKESEALRSLFPAVTLTFRGPLAVFRRGNRLSNATQEREQLAMHGFVAAADGAGLKEVGFAIGAGHEAARFADEQ
jgi:hypothetical protein